MFCKSLCLICDAEKPHVYKNRICPKMILLVENNLSVPNEQKNLLKRKLEKFQKVIGLYKDTKHVLDTRVITISNFITKCRTDNIK